LLQQVLQLQEGGLMKKIIVGMSGASGQIYGIKLLEYFRNLPDVETHLVMSAWAKQTTLLETDWKVEEVEGLADYVHDINNLAASMSSGSFRRDGMAIMPCSIKTLSAIANSYNDNLMIRAADVTLKEKKPLILILRETPLHLGHIRLMAQAAEAGAVITPPMPEFYTKPASIDDLIDQTVFRVADLLGFPSGYLQRWGE
jgi:4-hydroxy-3-polyprenylbenzoate decarboxylase